MTTTGAPAPAQAPLPSLSTTTSTVSEQNNDYKTAFSKEDKQQILEYNIILYKKCNEIIILQYIHSIISIILVLSIIYVFYIILKRNQ